MKSKHLVFSTSSRCWRYEISSVHIFSTTGGNCQKVISLAHKLCDLTKGGVVGDKDGRFQSSFESGRQYSIFGFENFLKFIKI